MLNSSSPESVFDGLFTWDYWTITRLGDDLDTLIVGNVMYNVVVLREDIESEYPGFVHAYEALTALGCNEVFTTKVLKFCILHAAGSSMAEVLDAYDILPKALTAITLDLSADELLASIEHSNHGESSILLPDNMTLNTG